MTNLFRPVQSPTLRSELQHPGYSYREYSPSERHLRRGFERELGIGPKEMLGIIRFQSMLREIHGGSGARLGYADLAAKYGYYDQSHLIKTFKRYYGMSPTQVWGRTVRSEDVRFFLLSRYFIEV